MSGSFQRTFERSSFGSKDAARARRSVTSADAARVVARANQISAKKAVRPRPKTGGG
jgi:hypothetical protein